MTMRPAFWALNSPETARPINDPTAQVEWYVDGQPLQMANAGDTVEWPATPVRHHREQLIAHHPALGTPDDPSGWTQAQSAGGGGRAVHPIS